MVVIEARCVSCVYVGAGRIALSMLLPDLRKISIVGAAVRWGVVGARA